MSDDYEVFSTPAMGFGTAYKLIIEQTLPPQKELEDYDVIIVARTFRALIDGQLDEQDIETIDNRIFIVLGVAVPILIYFLGADWVAKHTIFGLGSGIVRNAVIGGMRARFEGGELQAESYEDLVQLEKAIVNTLELAEALFNLRTCPGFRGKLQDLHASREMTDDIYTEFLVAQMLFIRGAYVEIIHSSAKQGRDYDVIQYSQMEQL